MTYGDVAYTAVAAFFVLLIIGIWFEELEAKYAIVLVVIWACGFAIFKFFGISRLLFVPVEVVLDIILILKIFGGDVRINSD